MNIMRIQILERNGTDLVYLHTDLSTPFPKWDDSPLCAQFETQKGYAQQYVRENFNLEPEFVIPRGE